MTVRIAVFNHFPEILNRFKDYFELQGFTVRTFLQELGKQPLLEDFTADLILLGHIRGYPSNYPDFIRELRADPVTQALPILVCTTGEVELVDDGSEETVRFVSIGADALDLENVLLAIRLALNLDYEAD